MKTIWARPQTVRDEVREIASDLRVCSRNRSREPSPSRISSMSTLRDLVDARLLADGPETKNQKLGRGKAGALPGPRLTGGEIKWLETLDLDAAGEHS
jgi:hypothetical protein